MKDWEAVAWWMGCLFLVLGQKYHFPFVVPWGLRLLGVELGRYGFPRSASSSVICAEIKLALCDCIMLADSLRPCANCFWFATLGVWYSKSLLYLCRRNQRHACLAYCLRRPLRLSVRTQGFHPWKRSSILLGATDNKKRRLRNGKS